MNDQDRPNYWLQRPLRRRRLLTGFGVAGAGALGLALVGCGGDDDSGGPATPNLQNAPTPLPTVAKTIKRGGKHTAVWETEPLGQFDPHLVTSGFVVPASMALYDGYLRQNPAKLSEIIPGLAEKWEQPDPVTFVLTLRKGVKFHDGTDYNSEIAKWNAERILGKGFVSEGKYSGTAAGLTKIETPDPSTIKFTFDKQKVDSIEAFYFAGGGIGGTVSRKAAEAAGKDFWKNPVGTGPYMFKSWDVGSKIVLVPNPNYFEKVEGQAVPFIDEFNFIALPDPAVRVVNVKNGQVSSTKIEVDQVKDVESKDIYIVNGGPEPLQIYMNHQSGIFKDVNIRRALAYAVDREALAKTVFFGQAQPTLGIPKRSKWNDPTFTAYAYDPKKAKEAMAAGGMPNGFSFEMMVLPTGVRPKAVEFIQAQVASLGIKIEIRPMESAAYVDRLFTRGEGDAFFALTGTLGLTEAAGFEANGGPLPSRKSNPNDPKMTEFINNIKATFDPEARKKVIWDAQRYHFYDLVAVVPVVDAFRPHAVRADWQGFSMAPPDSFYPDYRGVRLTS